VTTPETIDQIHELILDEEILRLLDALVSVTCMLFVNVFAEAITNKLKMGFSYCVTVQRSWTVWGSNPHVGEFFRTRRDRS
jgi:hypothetical protein